MTISNTTDLPAPQCHLNNTMANLEIRVQTNTSLLWQNASTYVEVYI